MTADLDKIAAELASLGYAPARGDSLVGPVVVVEYEIPNGSHAGTRVQLGLSFQEAGYPEYPPHWIHVSPPHGDGRSGGSDKSYTDEDDRSWLAMSRPPSDFWDKVPPADQNMRTFFRRHVSRIWRNV